MKNRILALILIICFGISSLSGCGRMGQEANPGEESQESKQQTVADENVESEDGGQGREQRAWKRTRRSGAGYRRTANHENSCKKYDIFNEKY